MTKRVLVTGASGFLGGYILDGLRGHVSDVHAWRRRPLELLELSELEIGNDGVIWHQVNVLDRLSVIDAVERAQPDEVYHCAGLANPRLAATDPKRAFDVNLIGTLNLLEAIRTSSKNARVLVPSSGLVYATQNSSAIEESPCVPDSPYSASKIAQESIALHFAEAYNVDIVIARTFNSIGPRQSTDYSIASFASQLAALERNGGTPILRTGDLSNVRDFLDVRDAVSAFKMLLDRGQPGRTYNVCTGQGRKVGELLNDLLSMTRLSPMVQEIASPSRRAMDRKVLVGNHSRITQEVGWSTQFSIQATLRDTLQHWRDTLNS